GSSACSRRGTAPPDRRRARSLPRRLANLPILRPMQTPEPLPPSRAAADPLEARPAPRPPVPGYWGERLAWIAGLVLAISAFTDWYSGSEADGLTLSVTGWHTGALGKLVFFCGLATLILEALRAGGDARPAAAARCYTPH